MDSLGSRYGGKYASDYAPGGMPADSSYGSSGNAHQLSYGPDNYSVVTFDAWNQLVGINNNDTTKSAGDRTLEYDALGRLITVSRTIAGTTITTENYYDGQNLIIDEAGQLHRQLV